MEFYSGLDFFTYLFILMIPAIVLGIKEKSLKLYRMFLTVIFIWIIYKENQNQFRYLIAYTVLATYLCYFFLKLREKFGKNNFIYFHAVLLGLLPLIIYKISLNTGESIFGFVGISYICFKVIQTIIEIFDGVIKEFNVLEFLNFILFFPCLSSGPIDRSRRFGEDYNKIYSREEYLDLLGKGGAEPHCRPVL